MRYYLAYGSNLNPVQMKERCPKARLVGTGQINGWRLTFQKSISGFYLNIVPSSADACVPVAIFALTDEDECELDKREGYPNCYQKRSFKLVVNTGKRGRRPAVDAFAYLMPKSRPFGVPANWYEQRVLKGYDHFGFPKRILTEAHLYSAAKMKKTFNLDDFTRIK